MLRRVLLLTSGIALSACGGESFSEATPELPADDADEDAGESAGDDDQNPADDTTPEGDDDVADDDAAPSGDDSGLGLVIGDEVSLEQLPAAVGRAVCARLFACCSAAERGDVGETEDQCTVNTSLVLSLIYLGAVTESQREGRLTYHGDRAADCLREFDRTACDELPSTLCADAVEPLLGRGEYCKHDVECIPGACLVDTCGAPQDLDGACADDPDCESGHCSTLTGTCARLGEEGESCTENAHCASGNCAPDSLSCSEPIPAACQ